MASLGAIWALAGIALALIGKHTRVANPFVSWTELGLLAAGITATGVSGTAFAERAAGAIALVRHADRECRGTILGVGTLLVFTIVPPPEGADPAAVLLGRISTAIAVLTLVVLTVADALAGR